MKTILKSTTALLIAMNFAGQAVSAEMLKEIGKGEGEVSIVAWAGYIERGETDKGYDWVTSFEKETGCKVSVKTAATSDEMVTLMNQGGFDLVTASGDASLRLVAGGKVAPINTALIKLGLIHEPLAFLLYSSFAVVVAYVHQLTIFMVVPIFNSMARIDKRVVEAAVDAGASRLDIMRLIVIPLSKSGVALGSIFVVAIVMGDFFVTKVMSGGGSASVVGAFYEDIGVLQYPTAAASAVILTVVLMVSVALILRTVDIRREITQ